MSIDLTQELIKFLENDDLTSFSKLLQDNPQLYSQTYDGENLINYSLSYDDLDDPKFSKFVLENSPAEYLVKNDEKTGNVLINALKTKNLNTARLFLNSNKFDKNTTDQSDSSIGYLFAHFFPEESIDIIIKNGFLNDYHNKNNLLHKLIKQQNINGINILLNEQNLPEEYISNYLTFAINNRSEKAFNVLFNHSEKNFYDLPYADLFKMCSGLNLADATNTVLLSEMVILDGDDILNLIKMATQPSEFIEQKITESILKYLVEIYVDFSSYRDNFDLSGLELAIKNENMHAFKIIIANHNKLHDVLGEEGPLFFAVKNDKPEFVKILFDYGVESQQFDNNDNTPLIVAMKRPVINVDMITTLLSKYPPINYKNKQGETALSIGITKKALHIVPYLLLAGADISTSVVNLKNNTDSYILDGNGQFNSAMKFEDTLKVDSFNVLVHLGMKMDAKDDNGNDFLLNSILNQQVSNFASLLKHYLICEQKNNDGNTPLLLSYKSVIPDFFELLMDKVERMDIFHKNNIGENIFDLVIKKQEYSLLNKILSKAIDIPKEQFSFILNNSKHIDLSIIYDKLSHDGEINVLELIDENDNNFLMKSIIDRNDKQFEFLLDKIKDNNNLLIVHNKEGLNIIDMIYQLPEKKMLKFISILDKHALQYAKISKKKTIVSKIKKLEKIIDQKSSSTQIEFTE